MRIARIKKDGSAYYHCVSRFIERRPVLDSRAKAKFHQIMRKLAEFCGVEILTYALMDTHYHILVHVPERQEISDEELVRRLGILYEPHVVKDLAAQLKDYRDQGLHQAAEEFKAGFTYRMYDLSEFMKTLKQRFSQWHNRLNGRNGPLWEQRFKSLLVEDSPAAIWTIAAYIDLNPVRAGIAADPKDYRYCGYGEAMGGSDTARAGLLAIARASGAAETWSDAAHAYRIHLYVAGETRKSRPGFTPGTVAQVLAAGGKLSLAEALHCRVRYFSDGLVLGGRDFVDGMFAKYRDQFGSKRATGARPMRYADWPGLCTLRDLRLAPVSASP